MLNPRAIALVAESAPPPATSHDWWCYLLVTAAGGQCLHDDAEVILYRQHPGNAVGSSRSTLRRTLAAMRRGPSAFMGLLRAHRMRSSVALLPLGRTDVLGRPGFGVFELSLWMTLSTTRRVSSGGSSC